MTDEELDAAKALMERYDERHHMGIGLGYAAACEAKQASFGKQSQGGKTMLTLLEAERARSAKLIDLLRDLRPLVITFEASFGAGFPMSDRIDAVIAEYEADK